MIQEYTYEFLRCSGTKPVKGARVETKAGVFKLYMQCWHKATWCAYSNNFTGFIQSRTHLIKEAFLHFKMKHYYGGFYKKGVLKTQPGCIPTVDDIG